MNSEPENEESLENIFEDYYSKDPQMGDIVFLKNRFEDCSIRGELVGMQRINPQRALDPAGAYEAVLYPGLLIKIAGIDEWLDTDEDWEITDRLSGFQYKKLPPEVVTQSKEKDETDE